MLNIPPPLPQNHLIFLKLIFWIHQKKAEKKKRPPLKPWSTLFFDPHVLQWLPHLQLGHKHEPIPIGWSSRRGACEFSGPVVDRNNLDPFFQLSHSPQMWPARRAGGKTSCGNSKNIWELPKNNEKIWCFPRKMGCVQCFSSKTPITSSDFPKDTCIWSKDLGILNLPLQFTTSLHMYHWYCCGLIPWT